jgi:hypothetical protein
MRILLSDKQIKYQALPAVVLSIFSVGLSRSDRDNYVRELSAAGWTQSSIGVAAKLSRERVRQILVSPEFKVTGFVVPKPPRKPEPAKVEYIEPEPAMLSRLLELQPLARQVRSNSPMYRSEAEEYTRLLAKAHIEGGVTLYRLAKRLGVTHGAIRFRLVRYGFLNTTGKSKSYRKVNEKNRVDS